METECVPLWGDQVGRFIGNPGQFPDEVPGSTDPFLRLGTLLNRVRPDAFTYFILLTLPSQPGVEVFRHSVLLLYLECGSCEALPLNAMGSNQSCLFNHSVLFPDFYFFCHCILISLSHISVLQ